MKKPWQLKLRALLSALLFIMLQSAVAQITFQKEYYYSSGAHYAMAVAQDKNSNNYYFAGLNDAGGTSHAHLGTVAKTNFKGVWQWARMTSSNHHPAGWTDIKSTYSNVNVHTGVVAAGHSYYSDFLYFGAGFRLSRIDPSGTTTQYKTYTPSNVEGVSYKVEQATLLNGNVDGFIAAGAVSASGLQKPYIVRTDEALATTWSTILTNTGTPGHARALSVKQTADKGFIITGVIGMISHPNNKIFVVKLDALGAITWQRFYQLPSVSAWGDDIVEVMNGSQSEYYVLAHSEGTNSNVAILHLNNTGAVLNSKYFNLPGKQTARGMVYMPTGHLVFTCVTDQGSMFARPVLVKTNTALNSISFGKEYSNLLWASCPIPTTDGGYLIGSSRAEVMSNNNEPYHLIKTDDVGVSGCAETNRIPTFINLVPSVTTADFTAASGYTDSDLTSIDPITLTEETICKDFCRGVTYPTDHVNAHACHGQTINLTANCLGAAVIKWFKAPDFNTVIATGISYSPNNALGNADYVSRCYDADGCITYELYHHFTVSPAPFSIGQTIQACYGQYLTLNSGCGIGQTSHWISPVTSTGPTINIEALSNQTYIVECRDQYGCLVQTNNITVEITTYPAVQIAPGIGICEGASYDLNNALPPGSINCTWSELPNYNPVFGSIVTPSTTTNYFAECRDAQGCISYHVMEVAVNPAPIVGSIATMVCQGNNVYLNSFAGPGCNWTWVDINTNLPVPGNGFAPTNSSVYRGTCIDVNGCISYYDIQVDVIPWTVIPYTVYAPCNQVFDFNPYSTLCDYGITAWASLIGNDYVLFPVGWAPTANITVYGFGTNMLGYCCRVEMQIIVTPAEPTYHELCYSGIPHMFSFNCPPGSTMQWLKNGVPQPGSIVTVNSVGTYEVICTDDVTGCIVRHAIFNVVEGQGCEVNVGCYMPGMWLYTNGCPPGSTTASYEKNGVPYPALLPLPSTTSFSLPTNGPGTYTLTCRDAQGNIVARKYYHLYSCDEEILDKTTPKGDPTEKLVNGVSHLDVEPSIDVYPNPGSGIFNISVKSATGNDCAVKVYDMLGREVVNIRNADTTSAIMFDLIGKASGVYHVQVVIDGNMYSRKVVLQ